jgi:hypothetical protein
MLQRGIYTGTAELQHRIMSLQYHPDGNREIRSMTIAAMPLPPLPVIVCKELEGESSFVAPDHSVASSHDLIAHFMNVTCAVASSCVNSKRMSVQSDIERQLFARVDEWQDVNDPCRGDSFMVPCEEWCYELVAEFSRMYMSSYLVNRTGSLPDIRFSPASDIDRSHIVYRVALEFQRAQDVLYGKSRWPHAPLMEMSFSQLVQHSVRRMLESRVLPPLK